MNALIKSKETSDHAMNTLQRLVKKEIQKMRKAPPSFMDKEDIADFNWAALWLQLTKKAPTLMRILETLLLQESGKNKPLVCFLASIVLKHQCQKLAFVQRAISLLLYGNGTSKEVSSAIDLWLKCMVLSTVVFLPSRSTIACSPL